MNINRQYIGARYVPIFYSNPDGSNNWKNGVSYEALTIVQYNNSSYTSKIPVPANIGNPADNKKYWALTGNYNGQVEAYLQESKEYMNQVNEYKQETDGKIANINTRLNMQTRKYVFIGDSYNASYHANGGWGQVIANIYGLVKGVDFYSGALGGASLAGDGANTLLQVTKDTIQTIPADIRPLITDIVVMGGINDWNSPATDVRDGMIRINNYVKSTLPNAHLYFPFCQYAYELKGTVMSGYMKVVRGVIGLAKNKFTIDNTMWKSLAPFYLESDGVHPNGMGMNIIAENIWNMIHGGGRNQYFYNFWQAVCRIPEYEGQDEQRLTIRGTQIEQTMLLSCDPFININLNKVVPESKDFILGQIDGEINQENNFVTEQIRRLEFLAYVGIFQEDGQNFNTILSMKFEYNAGTKKFDVICSIRDYTSSFTSSIKMVTFYGLNGIYNMAPYIE